MINATVERTSEISSFSVLFVYLISAVIEGSENGSFVYLISAVIEGSENGSFVYLISAVSVGSENGSFVQVSKSAKK